MHPFINIFGLSLPMYGSMLIIGFVAAWGLMILLSRKKPLPGGGDMTMAFLISICGGIAGAFILRPIFRIFEVAGSWESYSHLSFFELFRYITGEIVFYGGLIGGIAAAVIYARKNKIPVRPMFDLFVPVAALGHVFGRSGCVFAGCCYGMEVAAGHPLALVYPIGSPAPAGIPLLAVPLIESSFMLILAVVLAVLYLKVNKTGVCASIYMLAYPPFRFVLEFFRGDAIRGTVGAITTSQFISILLFIIGAAYLAFSLRAGKNI